MISAEFLKRYEQSVEAGEDDYSLVDHSCVKPLKENFNCFENKILVDPKLANSSLTGSNFFMSIGFLLHSLVT